jgi:nicotinamidase-related amidase
LRSPKLIIENSILLVIDVQGKLASVMHDKHYVRHIQGMIKAAQILGIPIIVTEQAPEKIGNTIPEIREMLPENLPINKQTFSCCGEPVFLETVKNSRRKQILICGIEAHVCVYQTVRDLLTAGHDVYLVVDAVSSRSAHNTEIGIKRSEGDGATLTTLEMIITELIQSTRHPKFREIMALLKNA